MTILKQIRKDLTALADPKFKEGSKHFFKEKDEFHVYGVSMQKISILAKEYLKKEIKGLSKKETFALCQELWQSNMLEECVLACSFAYAFKDDFKPADFKIFEHWVKNYLTNWAACDTLCNHTIGDFVMMYPQYAQELKKWAKSQNRWIKRAAAVTLIIPARKGLFHKEAFEIADILLLDTDDMVQKGYGWMLKSVSEGSSKFGTKPVTGPSVKAVFDYVVKHKDIMPRTALRYAIEKMAPNLKKQAMAK